MWPAFTLLLLVQPVTALPVPAKDGPCGDNATWARRVQHPDDAAVVVAVEDYAFLPDAPFADDDAELFARTVREARGIPPSRIRVLTQDASREAILRSVAEAADTVKAGTLWLYFAGLGVPDMEDRSPLLVGVYGRGDVGALARDGVTVDELLSAAGGAKVVAVLEASFTGVSRSGIDIASGVRFVVPDYAVVGRPGATVWLAAGTQQVNQAVASVQHGAFTWFYVDGMNGAADGAVDGTSNGMVTSDELLVYINRCLSEATKGKQSAVLTGEPHIVTEQAQAK